MKKMILCFILILNFGLIEAQQIPLKGTIKNKETGEGIPSATVMVKGKTIATVADEKGNFNLIVKALPVTLLVSSANFEKEEIFVNNQQDLYIRLNPPPPMSEVVIQGGGDSRIRSKVINAPYSYERIGLNQLRNSPSPDPYNLLLSLKGADAVQSSITMNTVSTRGFNGSGSTRVNQIVDGMDNQAPGLNFFVGNFAGLTELDVESMELLPGASSALYGPGGMNGTILINSKDPFKYQGLSVVVKEGIMHVDERQRSMSPYHNFSIRYAKAFKDKIAFKLSAQYLSAKDWLANDSSNYSGEGPAGKLAPGTRATDPNYNGVNVYGDEASANIHDVALYLESIGAIPPGTSNFVPVDAKASRTGYHEKDMVVDPDARNIKLSGALHYKLTKKIEAQLMGYWGTGNTVYTGNNRYILKGIKIGQYKLELKHPNWFLRGYTTQEDAGESYTATITALNVNNQWKSHPNWFGQYAGAFVTGKALYQMNDVQAHGFARSIADKERPLPGTPEFKKILDQVRKTSVSETGKGGLFLEKSQLWMAEGQYNLKQVKFVDIIVGANIKKYILNSKGTVFIDTAGTIKINEIGAYAQLTKRLFKDYLTLSFAGRMDKNEDFKEQFTPRVNALVKLAENHNLRFSYQTSIAAFSSRRSVTFIIHR